MGEKTVTTHTPLGVSGTVGGMATAVMASPTAVTHLLYSGAVRNADGASSATVSSRATAGRGAK